LLGVEREWMLDKLVLELIYALLGNCLDRHLGHGSVVAPHHQVSLRPASCPDQGRNVPDDV
jgi:hypothetical protein